MKTYVAVKKTNENNSSSGGIGFCGALTILFVALKLTGYIDWEWVWVLSPIWISVLVFIAIVALVLIAGITIQVAERFIK